VEKKKRMILSVIFYYFIFSKLDKLLSTFLKENTSRKKSEKKSRLILLIFSSILCFSSFFHWNFFLNLFGDGFIGGYFIYDYHFKKDDKEKNKGVFIHHALSFLFINGFLIVEKNDAINLFSRGCLPVIFISTKKLLFEKQLPFLVTKIIDKIILLTYTYRILLFSSILFSGILPSSLGLASTLFFFLNPWNYFALTSLLILFLMNIVWFIQIIIINIKDSRRSKESQK
jgi:hypothetical protein